MKRFVAATLLMIPLVVGMAGCKKAHDAGNDSMSIGGSKIESSTSALANGASAGEHY
ncbi:hypothetical protein [Caballeronia sp. INDeC2]|uniref:hypothetical protein n=1 Tax=Caballeronia sp. INDeC2 TaxID=2921747 RepID=UPI002028A703|nr:hypothetical protein [Caballeronia sp. INDeC2]